MRTFEQYINEARQDYIFGGTDDRNTNSVEEHKTLGELKKGDKVYQFAKGYNCVYEYTLQYDLDVSGNRVYMYFLGYYKMHYKYSDRDKEFSIDDNRNYYNVFATSYEVLCNVMKKEFNIDIDAYSVEAVNEARQDYIFGGTDNRNTDIEKTFASLANGEFIFVFHETKRSSGTLPELFAWMVGGWYVEHVGGWREYLAMHELIDRSSAETIEMYLTTSLSDAERKYKEIWRKYPTKVSVNASEEMDLIDMNISEFRKKFASKINEVKQNYIFGGTDDRAPKVENTFSELEKGDDIFYAYINGDKTVHVLRKYTCYEIKKDEKTGKLLIWFFQNGAKSDTTFAIINEDIYSAIRIIKLGGYRSGMASILSTDEDMILREVNSITKKNYTVDDFDIIE